MRRCWSAPARRPTETTPPARHSLPTQALSPAPPRLRRSAGDRGWARHTSPMDERGATRVTRLNSSLHLAVKSEPETQGGKHLTVTRRCRAQSPMVSQLSEEPETVPTNPVVHRHDDELVCRQSVPNHHSARHPRPNHPRTRKTTRRC